MDERAIRDYAHEEAAAITAAKADIGEFCKDWPCAKRVLELLKQYVKNPLLRAAVQALIDIGDKLCPPKK
jgi:hypothetical protein